MTLREAILEEEWYLHPEPEDPPVVYSEGLVVATVNTPTTYPGEREARARMIVAAPSAIRACKSMLDAFHLIPLPECEEEYRELEAARQQLIDVMSIVHSETDSSSSEEGSSM